MVGSLVHRGAAFQNTERANEVIGSNPVLRNVTTKMYASIFRNFKSFIIQSICTHIRAYFVTNYICYDWLYKYTIGILPLLGVA